MTALKQKIVFDNGQVIELTTGEIKAIERYVRQNGTDPKKVQYNPGGVQYRTTFNLVQKGIMRTDERGLFYFAEGFLILQRATVHNANPFTLTDRFQKPLLAPVKKMFKIQPSSFIDQITAEGHELSKLPYPFFVDENGAVGQQDLWKGDPARVIGFQKDLARNQVDLWWREAVKDPQRAQGMYLVTADSKGTLGVHTTAVDSVTVFETDRSL